jgi:hypothetical protein
MLKFLQPTAILIFGIAIGYGLGVEYPFLIIPTTYENVSNQSSDSAAKQKDSQELFRQRLIGDPVALFTAILSIFTGILTCVGYKQYWLGRDEFISTHRPKITARAFIFNWTEFNENEDYRIAFIYRNEGNSTAKIIDIGTAIIISGEYDRIDVAFPGFKKIKIQKPLDVGDEDTGYSAGAVCTNNAFRDQISKEKCGMFFVGYISYEDLRGIKRRTGFSRKCNRYLNLEHYPNEEYDYSY